MRITSLEDQALRCLSLLARTGRKLTIGQIAESEGLSDENGAKVLARLKALGLVKSFRGKDGGYVLARPADEISLADVLVRLGGDLFEQERCHGHDSGPACVHGSDCGIRPVWLTLGELVQRFLASVTLADLAHPEQTVCERMDALYADLNAERLEAVDAADAVDIDRPIEASPAVPLRGLDETVSEARR